MTQINSTHDDHMIRDQNSFKHAIEIQKPFGEIDIVLNWAKSELADEWRWQLIDVSTHARPGRYIFYFDSERDYLTFVLKWS